MIRVMLVDDHAVLRTGLKLVLEQQPDLVVVGEAADAAAAEADLPRLSPDVVVTDLSMPGSAGVDFLGRLGPRVLVLTMHDQPSWRARAMAAGALGFVAKASADTLLVRAVREVAAGHRFIDPRVGDDGPVSGRGRLSGRESEVLRLVAIGHTNREIAGSLGLSEKTVETYRSRVREKLSIRSRADFLTAARAAALVDA
jgi:two-component system, NarL family, response regulator NreC